MRYLIGAVTLVLLLFAFTAKAELKTDVDGRTLDAEQDITKPADTPKPANQTPAPNTTQSNDTTGANVKTPKLTTLSELENMPAQSLVLISGTVNTVNGKNVFELRDNKTGKSVEVQTKEAANVSKGQIIKVQGRVENKLFGDKRIISASVMTY